RGRRTTRRDVPSPFGGTPSAVPNSSKPHKSKNSKKCLLNTMPAGSQSPHSPVNRRRYTRLAMPSPVSLQEAYLRRQRNPPLRRCQIPQASPHWRNPDRFKPQFQGTNCLPQPAQGKQLAARGGTWNGFQGGIEADL